MSEDLTRFDDAILLDLDAALDLLGNAVMADSRDTMSKLRLRASVDLLSRLRRIHLISTRLSAKEKYLTIAEGIAGVFDAWADVPPKFARYYMPDDVYEMLYPLYATAVHRVSRSD